MSRITWLFVIMLLPCITYTLITGQAQQEYNIKYNYTPPTNLYDAFTHPVMIWEVVSVLPVWEQVFLVLLYLGWFGRTSISLYNHVRIGLCEVLPKSLLACLLYYSHLLHGHICTEGGGA